MTTALPAHTKRRGFGIDLSIPVLLLFAAVLCLLIVLPLGWLAAFAFTDKTGAFTLAKANFVLGTAADTPDFAPVAHWGGAVHVPDPLHAAFA